VIVDSPAAGHGIGILRTPRTFAEIARVGPIAGTAQRIAATVADPDFTAVVAVCIAEEMPVNETLWLRDQLRADGLELGAVFANALLPDRFTDAEARRLRDAHQRGGTGADGALAAALSEHARAAAQRGELARLRDGLGAGVPGVELPFLFGETLGVPELLALADALRDIG
jgi:anion-transporting  ArsA/GET3 family ATPase